MEMEPQVIRNCRFKFRCDQTWDALAPTDRPNVRFCGDCERTVHLCTTPESLLTAIVNDHCVAFDRKAMAIAPFLPDGPEIHVGEMTIYRE